MNSQAVNISQTDASLNPVHYPVLAVLAQGPAHGYDLYQYLRTNLGPVWGLGLSQVYGLLAKLEQAGLVGHERISQDTRPDKKVFRLTPAGSEAFAAWVSAPVKRMRELRLDFLAKLHFARLVGPEVEARLLIDQLAICRRKAIEVKTRRRACTSPTEGRALDYRLAMIEAAVSWLARCLDQEDSQTDVLPSQ